MSDTAKKKPKDALSKFVIRKRRAEHMKDCPVCKLPSSFIAEIKAAPHKKYTNEEICAWLKAEGYPKITPEDITRHRSGRHDAEV